MAEATFYPNKDGDESPTTVDGDTERVVTSGVGWDDIHDGAGTSAFPAGATLSIAILTHSTSGWVGIARGTILFDVSSLSGKYVHTAELRVKESEGDSTNNLGYYTEDTFAVNVYTSSPASNTNLVAADYQQYGIQPLSTAIVHDDLSLIAFNSFILNNTGQTVVQDAIDGDGIVKLALREAFWDVPDTEPSWWSNARVSFVFESADSLAEAPPELIITYEDYPKFIPQVWIM